MRLTDQVCSLEQARRLHELGINQESQFYFVQENTPTNPNMILYGYPQESIPIILVYGKRSHLSTANVYLEYSAFNVSELGVMLPYWYCSLQMGKGGFACCYIPTLGVDFTNQKGHVTEAQARAEVLIALIERDIYSSNCVNEEINKP